MKIFSFLFFFLFSFCTQASIFSPAVTCETKLNRALCGIKNLTNHVMSCEFLVVGETATGKLLSQTKNSIVRPDDNEQLELTVESSAKDSIKFASGEAICTKL